uniref:Reverse transcriptase Ty1/copia-type domain-containing protein n=1 Tax=Tanacetum cinerariifolium TaxID=118510 RepID=A0A6L2JP54_TANCI|nr:hypothetical protein [Tanacetum cinerariifolium]
MHDEFEMSMMGELNFFLGLQIKQMEHEIFFNQSKYIKEMLKKFRLEDSKPTKTPMSTEIKLTKDDEADSVDSSKYRGMISSLLYLTASRPDIMFSVCLCACFQENPKTAHLEAVKCIFRYIRGTSHLGLWYRKGTEIETIVYADSDHTGDYVDHQSTSYVCTFMGYCLTSWFAKKQTALAIITTEAEYDFAGKACQQALWMKQALIDYGKRLDDVLIMCDNKGAIDFQDIYKTLESRYVHEGGTIDPSFYNDPSDDSVAKFTAIGFDCLLSLDEQIFPSKKVKTGLGYDSQFNEKEVVVVKEEEVTETMFDNRSSDKENSTANERFKKAEGYHAVPPPITRNYMPPKYNLLFVGLDYSIYTFKISETVTSVTKDEKDAPETSTAYVDKPKEDRSSALLIHSC